MAGPSATDFIIKRVTASVCFWLITGPASAWAGEAIVPFNLITHSEVVINRPAMDIWPYILDTSQWKIPVTSEWVSGAPGRVGEVRSIAGGEGEARYQFFIETVAQEDGRFKVIKIYPEDRSHLGFSAWRLFPLDGHTLVTYDVYSENRIPGLTAEQAKEQERLGIELNQPRFDQELQKLRSILESPEP